MVRMDKLLEAWRADPKVDATVELCAMLIRAALKAAPQKLLPDPFVIGFASEARSKHPTNLDVAIAVTDLYLISGLLTHAGAVLEMAEKLAPADARVKERLGKVRRRPTREFATKTTDPETLDAPTTPLDPPTEPAGVELAKDLKGPGGRRPTTIGLPAAPPPLPAPPLDRRTKMRASVVDPVEEKTEGDTHSEATATGVSDNPRRQKTFLYGPDAKEETARVPPEALPDDGRDDDSPPTKVDATGPTDAPITRVDAPGDDGPPTKVDPPASPAPFPPPKAPPLGPAPSPPSPKARDPFDAPSVVKALPPVVPLSSDTSDDSPPTAVQAVSTESLALSEIAKPRPAPRTLSSEVGRPLALPTKGGEPGFAAPLPRPTTDRGAKAKTDATWAKKTDDQRKAIKPTLLDSANLRRDDVRDDGPVTRVGAQRDSAPEPPRDQRVAARKPLGERRAVRPLPALEDNPVEMPTKVADAPEELLNASTAVRGPARVGLAIPPPPPSDPETETRTKVREPEVLEREREAALRRDAEPPARSSLADHELGEPSTLSGAITNLWTPPGSAPTATASPAAPPRPAPPRPIAFIEDSSALELSRDELIEDDDDDDEAVTGLKEPMPLVSAVANVRANLDAQRAPAVSKGGTLAMSVTPPASFPPVPPGASLEGDLDEADNPRTKILSPREAMSAAITADPRPPHARSRGASGLEGDALSTSGSLPYAAPAPLAMTTPPPVLSRGMLVGSGSIRPDAQASPEIPMFTPPPSVPTFGAPPSRPAQSQARALSPDEAPDPLALAPLGQLGILQSQSSLNPAAILQSGTSIPQLQPHDPALYASGAMRPLDVLASQQGPAMNVGYVARPSGEARPYKLYIALAVAILAVTGLVVYAAHLLLSGAAKPAAAEGTTVAPSTVVDALLRATPASLAAADVELTKLEAVPGAKLGKHRVEHRVLSSFEVSGADVGLRAAIDAARAEGVAADDLAYAELAVHVLAGATASADELVEAKHEARANDALFRWVTGVFYERAGRPEAKAEYEAALALRPTFAPPRLRLLRLAVLAGDTEALAVAKRDALVSVEALQALDAWSWAVSRVRGRQVGAAPTLALTSADVPRSLHPAFGAVATMLKDQKGADPTLKQAAAEAETPSLAVFWGEIGRARDDEGAVAVGALRALALAPGHPEALQLLVRQALETGQYQDLLVATKGLSPASAKPIQSVIAYETGDVGTLAALATDADAAVAEPSRARLALLRGPTLLTAAELERLVASDAEHGELCSVDRLVLVGAVREARAVVNKWPEGSHAGRALRLGRVLRAEGKWAQAEKLLGQAPANMATQIERILVGAETRENRSHARSLADERAGPAAPFLDAYVVARMGDVDAARAKLPSVLPSPDAPWTTQLAAVMLLAEIGDVRAADAIDLLSKKLGPNRDLARAADRFKETKPTADDESADKTPPGKKRPTRK